LLHQYTSPGPAAIFWWGERPREPARRQPRPTFNTQVQALWIARQILSVVLADGHHWFLIQQPEQEIVPADFILQPVASPRSTRVVTGL
jgi:hypothetical protein